MQISAKAYGTTNKPYAFFMFKDENFLKNRMTNATLNLNKKTALGKGEMEDEQNNI